MKKLSRAEQEMAEIEEVFCALSHGTRCQVLVVLQSRGAKLLAGDIADGFSCSWRTTTRHLKVLEKAWLEGEK